MQGPLEVFSGHRRPVIGLTPYVEPARFGPWDRECALIPMTYIEHIEAAGAVPVVIPAGADADSAVGILDGLVLPGGADVNPTLYHAQRHRLTDRPRLRRDAWEIAVLEAARRRGIPTLGICRGMQLLNVANGGSLVQALEDTAHAELHRAEVGVFGSHPVRIDAESWCASVMGEAAVVPTYHHQAVRTLGDGLRAVAWAEDGCIEAIETDGGPLTVGVQWHPEEQESSTLFVAFAGACTAVAESVGAR